MPSMSGNGDSGLKSAYERALEKLERQGIERPRPDALSDDVRARMEEVRSKAEAELAQAEILYRDRLRKEADPAQRAQAEEHYRRDRQRIEDERDRKLRRLRES